MIIWQFVCWHFESNRYVNSIQLSESNSISIWINLCLWITNISVYIEAKIILRLLFERELKYATEYRVQKASFVLKCESILQINE